MVVHPKAWKIDSAHIFSVQNRTFPLVKTFDSTFEMSFILALGPKFSAPGRNQFFQISSIMNFLRRFSQKIFIQLTWNFQNPLRTVFSRQWHIGLAKQLLPASWHFLEFRNRAKKIELPFSRYYRTAKNDQNAKPMCHCLENDAKKMFWKFQLIRGGTFSVNLRRRLTVGKISQNRIPHIFSPMSNHRSYMLKRRLLTNSDGWFRN